MLKGQAISQAAVVSGPVASSQSLIRSRRPRAAAVRILVTGAPRSTSNDRQGSCPKYAASSNGDQRPFPSIFAPRSSNFAIARTLPGPHAAMSGSVNSAP